MKVNVRLSLAGTTDGTMLRSFSSEISCPSEPESAVAVAPLWLTFSVHAFADATGQTAQSAARELRIWPRDIADAVASGAARLSSRKLENALTVCADIDRIYKGIPVPSRDTDPWVELKSVAAFIAR